MRLDIEAISGILGSVSIACWVVVFSPQIIENFRRSSADGLSVVFIAVWLLGDFFNILGAVLQKVLPTMVILAIYYTLADIVLLGQCFYYRGFTLKDTVSSTSEDESAPPTETSPLVPSRDPPELTRRTSSPFREYLTSVDAAHLSPATPLHDAKRDERALTGSSPVQKRSIIKPMLFNSIAIVVVFAAGIIGWYISTGSSREHENGGSRGHKSSKTSHQHLKFNILGQVFGYLCTALYLGSRIPQLLLNYRRKSTEGISMLFFIFACLGNLTYVLSILAFKPVCDHPKHCKSEEYASLYKGNVLVNLPWLLGSVGNLLQDAAVFVQYFLYRSSKSR